MKQYQVASAVELLLQSNSGASKVGRKYADVVTVEFADGSAFEIKITKKRRRHNAEEAEQGGEHA